ncbi:MAG: putative efflux system outer membrane protein [Phycisphaerales bacterium]|nr:putative efflux system outer membrane protein [Phycisphaerales bacterium]
MIRPVRSRSLTHTHGQYLMICKHTLGSIPLLALAGWLCCGGCAPDPKPFDPQAMQHVYRERATENVTRPLGALPLTLDRTFLVKRDGTQPASQPAPLPTTAESVGPVIRMSLRDLIQLAAINSLQVRVANYQPAVDENRVLEAEARFDPSFFTNLNFATQTILSPTPNTGTTSSGTQFQTSTLATGFKQNLPNGAQVQLQYQAIQTITKLPSATRFNAPFYESNWSFQVTQPLLQNAGTEVNRARIVVARNTQRVSLLDARLQLEKTLSEIEEAYWQLVQAESELKIQETLYNQSVDTAMLLQKRLGQDVTLVQTTQNNAALRGREAALEEARTRLSTFSNAIKRRVNDPNLPVAGSVVILPEDQPVQTPIAFDLAEQIAAGLANRAELAQQQIRIDSATVVYKAAQNNLLPQLNLVGSIGSKGGDASFGHAVDNNLFDNRAQEYSIGFQLDVPLGNREARAIFRRTQLQRLQAVDQYRDLIEQVCQEVRDAHDNVYTDWRRMQRNRQYLYSAEAALSAIQQEQDVGNVALTPDFVNRKLNAQEILAQARRENSRALTDYNVAISALERAKGTILKYDNVLMQEAPRVDGRAHRVARTQD